MRPLEGIKVLDFTQALAGVFCAYYMGDFGAEVIKVERPKYGDQSRGWGPFKNELSGYYASFNRSKKSITVDMRSEEGKHLILDLVKECDVVLENFKVGTLDRLGIGYERMKEVNPKIIYGSVSGFGIEGPLSHLPCYDIVAAARSGIVDRTGEKNGEPVKPGYSLCDNWSGLNLLNGISMALYRKEISGEGMRLDVSMLDSAFYLMDWPMIEYSVFGTIPERNGNHHVAIAPYGVYKAADGYVALAIECEEDWSKFCELMDLEHLNNNPKFIDNEARLKNLSELVEEIEKVTSEIPKLKIEKMLAPKGIAAGSVMTIPEVINSEQTKAREMVIEVNQKAIGKMKTMGIPMKFSKTPGNPYSSAPLLGEHNDEILRKLLYLRYTQEIHEDLYHKQVV